MAWESWKPGLENLSAALESSDYGSFVLGGAGVLLIRVLTPQNWYRVGDLIPASTQILYGARMPLSNIT